MKLLKDKKQIWDLRPTEEDLLEGAKYAAITLPWTFNRMSMNTSSQGLHRRALNIAKGIVAQEVLKRELEKRGVDVELERKSYRDEDFFDFRITKGAKTLDLDLKTINHYNNYNLGKKDEREPFSKELIMKYAGYSGPDWRQFFPMLIPHTQISQDKQAYCFAIASSIDFRKDLFTDRTAHKIVAFPYAEHLSFLSSKRLCLLREEKGQGVYINLYYTSDSMFKSDKLKLKVVGEWNGKVVERKVTVEAENLSNEIGPFSTVLNIELTKRDFDNLDNAQIIMSVAKNEYEEPVRNSLKANINIPPKNKLIFNKSDFCNLVLPSDYKVLFLGWIEKQQFLENCKKYPGYIWPDDKANKFENQLWSQITEKDLGTIKKCGFEDRISKKPTRLNAALLKTSGLGNGSACCYVYPNMHGGGIRETNLYNLPQDLNIMDTI